VLDGADQDGARPQVDRRRRADDGGRGGDPGGALGVAAMLLVRILEKRVKGPAGLMSVTGIDIRSAGWR
jgi:hypothetical protein